MLWGLAAMIYLSYICTRKQHQGELSSAGSERLPYKQRVGGSNPSAPTTPTINDLRKRKSFFCWYCCTARCVAVGPARGLAVKHAGRTKKRRIA